MCQMHSVHKTGCW